MSVYCCADLHGRMDLYKQIKAFLGPEDIVYFLGDAGDRGPQSWELIKTIYSDDQFIYLMGNHEEMLIEAMKDWLDCFHCGLNWQILVQNGGAQTFEDWMNISNEDNQRTWMNALNNLPNVRTYINKDNIKIILSHAGFTPGITTDIDFLWDRNHYNDEWDYEYCSDIIVVHGHTPIPLMKIGSPDGKFEPGDFWYCDNHKINIDNGSTWTGFTCLLDLDTFDEHIFYCEV